MDRRSFIFVLLLSITFMAVNTYFSNKQIEEKRQWLAEKERLEEKAAIRLKENVSHRTVTLEELPVTTSPKLKSTHTSGSIIFSDGDVSSTGAPLVAALSNDQKIDLQLVTREGDVSLGVWEDGIFLTPLEAPVEDALAFGLTSKGYLPVGIYSKENDGFIRLQQLPNVALTLHEELESPLGAKVPEQYYVINTPTQQLVFSNYGGALVEINLSFEGEDAVVRPIGADRELVEKHPENAQFPARPYLSVVDGEVQEKEPTLGGYYPLIRRAMKGSYGEELAAIEPQHYALNIVSEYPEVAELVYSVKNFSKNSITFEAVQRHRKITKTFSVNQAEEAAPYCVHLAIDVAGDRRGLWVTSGIPEVELLSGAPTNELKTRMTKGGSVSVDSLSLPKKTTNVSAIYPDWICNSNGFLGIIIDPLSKVGVGYRAERIEGTEAVSRLVQVGEEVEKHKAESLPGYNVMLPIEPSGGVQEFRIFAGPFAVDTLTAADSVYAAQGRDPDYSGARSFHGWFSFISKPFAKLLFIVMRFFHWVTDSWVASIVLLTVVLRLLLYPLNAYSMRSMRKLSKVSPKVQEIQAKHKKAPQKAQMEIMELYRSEGVNPMSGCLPLLIQMPFLIGMFDLLKTTFELRGAPFITGWIDNLTAPDVLLTWNYSLPIVGNELHLLPILLGGVMFVQSRMNKPAGQVMDEKAQQQKMMGNMMTLIFAVMFYNFPSGLNIYWLSSMLLGIVQQWFINRQVDNEPAKVEIVSGPKKKGKKNNKQAQGLA